MNWLLPRLARCAGIVALATVASFVMLRLLPGDPLAQSIEQRGRTAEARAELRARYALDAPLHEQGRRYLVSLVRGDLGTSLADGRSVAAAVYDASLLSVQLAVPALLGATVLGLLVGSARGWYAEHTGVRAVYQALTAITVLPEFMLALALLLLLAVKVRWFPVGGVADPLVAYSGSAGDRLLDRLHHLVLPAATLAIAWSATIARQQAVATGMARNALATRAAEARGVAPLPLWARYGLRVALPSSIGTIGLMFPVLVSGAIVVETVFSWPGLGRLIVLGIGNRDYPLVVGALLVTSTLLSVGTLMTDVLLQWADPRLAREQRRGAHS